MRHARSLLVGLVSTLVVMSSVVSSVDAVADPQLPGDTPAPAPIATAPAGDPATADGVVVLHTDSGADARSGELRDAIERLGATVRHTFGDQQTVSLELPAGTTAANTTAKLADLPGVAAVERPVTRSFDALPNDQYLPKQRSYLDAVAAPAAWNRQTGSSSVKIAIIDSGIDVKHPDLKSKIAGTYNAVTGSTSVKDTVGHGTFVAGVAAAATNNNRIGIAGAGYNSRILAVKVADTDGDIAVDDEIAGIRWAANHGAKVINLSLSGTDSSSAELKAVQYAQAKGALVVAAAGNDGDTTKQYPAAYPGVVAVGATDVSTGRRASFSTYGSWVTLAAPGVNIFSTTPLRTSDYFKADYDRGDGTSFSSPLVAGEAALLAAQNPSLKGPQLRAALVASAHGYANSGLGRGQVDFNRALDHVAPTTKPSAALVVGTSDTVTLTATSSAKRVSFRVDSGPWLPSVAGNGLTATRPFSTYGYADGTHTVYAVDCTAFGECNTVATAGQFTVSNAAPSLTVASSVSGPFTATATGPTSGGVRLLINGKEAAFDAAGSTSNTYTFSVNGSLYPDGANTQLTVQSCTASHSLCAGQRSSPTSVSFKSLHPTISTLSRTAISPNGDRSGDYAVLTFKLDQAQSVTVETRNSAGQAVRTDSVPSGTSYTWTGLNDSRRRLPDGNYRLAVVTSDSAGHHGLAERAVVVDTRFPRLQGIRGNGTRFFPVRDGYRDAFAPTASLPDGGRLTFSVASAARRTVRTLQANRAPVARTSLPWNGRTSAGHRVKAGTYRWTFSVADAAGNITRSPTYRTYVDSRRLRTKTVTVTKHAHTKIIGSAKCATRQASSYRRGAHLVNRCKHGSDEVSYATYTITMPKALRYGRMAFAAKGRSARTSQLSASFRRADGGIEVPRSVRVKPGKLKWHTVGRVPVAGHVHHGKINAALLLTTKYAGTNDFDARTVRLRVTVVRLG